MNDTTELIRTSAQQIVTLMKQMLPPSDPLDAAPAVVLIETTLRDALRQVGAEALSQFLSSGQGTPVAELPCACGGTLHYPRRRSATLVSVFGRVTYQRAYYAGCAWGHGSAPLDARYGLQPEQVSAGLAELLVLAGVELGFEHSEKWLKGFLLFSVSENTIRQATPARGQEQATRETAHLQNSQDLVWVQAHQRTTEPIPPRLYGSLDAAKVRIEPRDQAEKQVPHEAWRDMKVGCWYEVEPVSSAQRSTRQQAVVKRGPASLRATAIQYYCDIAAATTFGELMWASGGAACADGTPELIFVCDGAAWIWNQITDYYPAAIQIVDWYHAADRLVRVAQATLTTPLLRQAWRERVTAQRWEGHVDCVIQACETLAPDCSEARQAATYFRHNATRMRYAEFRAANYFIGSGTVESGCKQIVTQRLKCSGAQWSVTGAVLTAKARAAWLSGEWTPFCTRWAELPLAV